MSNYTINLKAIEQNDGSLVKDIKKLKESKKIQLLKAKIFGFTLKISDKFVHSVYDPIGQAKEFVQTHSPKDGVNYFILGMGLGYHVLELLKSKINYTRVFIIEKDLNIFRQALKVNDFSKYFGNRKIVWLVGKQPFDIHKAVTANTVAVMGSELSIWEYQPLVQLEQDYYTQVKEKIFDGVKTSSAIVDTMTYAGDNFIENTAKNMADFILNPGVKSLANKFKKIPAIIVSAGPSLDKNIDQLHKVKGKCLILATDTALKILRKHNLKPDFVFTVDYKPESRLHFENFGIEDVPLVFDPEASPVSLEVYKGPRFVSATEKPFTCWLNSIAGGKGLIPKGMSVAHYVFSVACGMGCAPIIFIGQDLSYPGGFTHAKGTTSREKLESSKMVSPKNLVKIKSLFDGQDLVTNKEMYIYLRHFEFLVGNSKRTCINSTEGGAGIKGTKVMKLKEAIKKYCKKDINSKVIIEKSRRESKIINKKIAVSRIKKMLFELDKFIAASEAVSISLQQVFTLCKKEKIEKIDKTKISFLLQQIKGPSKFIRKAELILKIIHADLFKEMIQLEKEKKLKITKIKNKDFSSFPVVLKDDYEFQIKLTKGAKFLKKCLVNGLAIVENFSHPH